MKHKHQMKIKNETQKMMAIMHTLSDLSAKPDIPKVLERLNEINPRNLPGDFSLKYYVFKSELEGLMKYIDPTYVNPMPPLFEPLKDTTKAVAAADIKPKHDLRGLPSVMRTRIKNAEALASTISKKTAAEICRPTGGAGSEPTTE
jgi:hypothetical protein